MKKWNRAWKIELIEETNPEWRDLWPTILGEKDVDSRAGGNDGRGNLRQSKKPGSAVEYGLGEESG